MKMKMTFSFFFFFFSISTITFSQVVNDECEGAILLDFDVDPCPDSETSIVSFEFNNIGATYTIDSPSACYGNPLAEGKDVWFEMENIPDLIEIKISDLENPNLVLYIGNSQQGCESKIQIDCWTSSNNELTIPMNIISNATYFLKISSEVESNFTLTFTSTYDCSNSFIEACLVEASFEAFPLPINNSYSPNETVLFCYTIEDWQTDIAGTEEWIHSIGVDFGSGWDTSSLVPFPPPSCDGFGYWGWYDSFISCNSGISFGPGFSYDSDNGIDSAINCEDTGYPGDGNPGNNYGDSCGNIGGSSPPKTFCWELTVKPDASFQDDLSFTIITYSDAVSGSYSVPYPCLTDNGLTYYITVGNCEVIPDIEATPTICTPACTGSILIPENIIFVDIYDITITDANNNIVHECLDCSPPLSIDNLCQGSYQVLLENDFNACFASNIMIASDNFVPEVDIIVSDPNCSGDSLYLDISSSSGIASSSWTPTGFNDSIPVTTPNTYTVEIIDSNGCESAPTSVEVDFYDLVISEPDSICRGDTVLLVVTGGDNYTWSTGAIGDSVVVSPESTETYSVSVTSVQTGCIDVVETTIFVNQKAPEMPLISGTGSYGGVEFTWPIIDTTLIMTIENLTGQLGIQTDSGYIVENLLEGDTVTVLFEVANTLGCARLIELTCISSICEEAAIVSILPPGTICLNENFSTVTLTASIDGNLTGAGTWSGEGIIDSIMGVFTPVESGVGLHAIAYTQISSDTCFSMTSSLLLIEEALDAPIINCTIIGDSILFSWEIVDNAESYIAEGISGQIGVFDEDERTYLIEDVGLAEVVTIQVVAIGDGFCDSNIIEKSCQTDCPNIELEILGTLAICSDETTTFSYQITGDDSGTATWSGTCFVNQASGIIDAQACGVGTHLVTLTYELGACSYQTTAEMIIYETPTAEIIIPAIGCVGETIQVSIDNNVPSLETYSWDFNNAIIVSSPPNTPYYEVMWPSVGTYTTSLITTNQNGCSLQVEKTIEINLFEDLDITCQATTSSITFNWLPITGAENYEYEISRSGNVDTTGVLTEPFFIMTDLFPEEEISIVVSVNGSGICAETIQMLSCSTLPCPVVDIAITAIDPICLGENPDSISLALTVTGGTEVGINHWSGVGITESTLGVFNPLIAGAGSHEIMVSYTEGFCIYEDIITIIVQEGIIDIAPILSVCEGEYFEFCLPEEYTYFWTGPNNFGSTIECLVLPDFDENLEGIYTLNVNFGNGCEMNTAIDVVMISNPIIALTSSDSTSCPHETFQLSVETTGMPEISWHPLSNVLCQDCPTTLAFISTSTNFIVQAVDEAGCSWLDMISIDRRAFCKTTIPSNDSEIYLNVPSGNEFEITHPEKKNILVKDVTMNIYPNPVQTTMNVRILGTKLGSLKILDLNGTLIKEMVFESNEIQLNCGNLPAGAYFLQLKTTKEVLISKFVVME